MEPISKNPPMLVTIPNAISKAFFISEVKRHSEPVLARFLLLKHVVDCDRGNCAFGRSNNSKLNVDRCIAGNKYPFHAGLLFLGCADQPVFVDLASQHFGQMRALSLVGAKKYSIAR